MKASANYVSNVSSAAMGQWPNLLRHLGIKVPKNGKHGPCPLCGGHDRFRFDDKEGRGTWICNQCGAGDGLSLISKAHGSAIKDAAKLIASLLPDQSTNHDQVKQNIKNRRMHNNYSDEQLEKKRQDAMTRANEMLNESSSDNSSPYIISKGLEALERLRTTTEYRVGGITFHVGSIIVPLINASGVCVNVQLITSTGEKRYLAGGQKQSAFHYIRGKQLFCIVEGYATGLSVHLATGASVYCAMDCGNLLPVAQIARSQHPDATILLCADNDANNPDNPGKTKAELAAQAIGGLVALPPINGDWNDYLQAYGVEATHSAITQAYTVIPCEPEKLQDNGSSAALKPDTHQLPEGFVIRGNYLCKLEMVGRGENAVAEYIVISSPIWVLAETSNARGQSYGRLLEWEDSSGRIRHWVMPIRALVPRNGEEVFSALLDSGLPFIALEHKRKLITYLMESKPERKITCVEKTGWHEQAYVLPHKAIGPYAEDVILQTQGCATNRLSEKGSLDEWKHNISALAVSNSRLCFALSLAFAAPLLALVGMEGGGFHLKGESTDGKTTIMKAAASVYGHPDSYIQTWRATGNAIEGIASHHNDALLCLDELGEMDGREAGQTAYMLANGQGKGRSKQDGELRERKAWRLLYLSTGELSLEDHATSAGQKTQAGMEVRTIQIPSNTGHYGAFETLHDMESGRSFADSLKAQAEQYHGVAFTAFIERLTTDLEQFKTSLRYEVKSLAEQFTPEGAGNQVGRAINRFAMVAAAGELATKLGITGWPEGEALSAAKTCLNAWLEERGHLGNKEDASALAQIRAFFSAHQHSRCADWFDPSHRPANMVGYRKSDAAGVNFFLTPAGWSEVSKGFEPKRTAQLCLKAGYLVIAKDKKRLQRQVRLPGMGTQTWVYQLNEKVLTGGNQPSDE
ncbi:DUF927 domain-containing protein [Escherichia coli]|nr:DUF927 domain-containing protein [Escherichia coli]